MSSAENPKPEKRNYPWDVPPVMRRSRGLRLPTFVGEVVAAIEKRMPTLNPVDMDTPFPVDYKANHNEIPLSGVLTDSTLLCVLLDRPDIQEFLTKSCGMKKPEMTKFIRYFNDIELGHHSGLLDNVIEQVDQARQERWNQKRAEETEMAGFSEAFPPTPPIEQEEVFVGTGRLDVWKQRIGAIVKWNHAHGEPEYTAVQEFLALLKTENETIYNRIAGMYNEQVAKVAAANAEKAADPAPQIPAADEAEPATEAPQAEGEPPVVRGHRKGGKRGGHAK